jgi:hypothetical protein
MEDSDCGEAGVCDTYSGVCQCSALLAGARCESCECGGFNSECMVKCDSDVTCSGNGRLVFLSCKILCTCKGVVTH